MTGPGDVGDGAATGRPTRRAVIVALLGGGAVVAAGGAYVVLSGGDDADTTSEPADVAADDALVAVGRRYLRDHPDEADAAVLLAALHALGDSVPAAPATRLAVLRDQVTADFEAGEVVEVDGWIISLTEARAAALYALDR